MKRGGHELGAALLAAMITVALVATLAAAALWRQWRGVEVESAERARVQSSWILTGALDWGRLVLAGDRTEDRRTGKYVDHLGEPWAVPLAEARLSTFLAAGESSTDTDRDAFLSGQVTDLQSRMNVMDLLVGNQQQQLDAYLRFERLFKALDLRGGELATLFDNLGRAEAAMNADKDEGGDAPLLPRRFDQLAWLGLTAPSLKVLQPYLTVLPVATDKGKVITPVNLNTASALVLFAVIPAIDLAGAQRLVAERDNRPFGSLQDAATLDPRVEPNTTWLSVNSNYFEIRGRLRLDDVALEEVAVVRRSNASGQSGVATLWRERTAVTVSSPPEPTR